MDESEAEAYARVQAEAAKGDANAQFELGVMLANGMGAAPHDHDAAIAWLLKAAEQGHPEAAGELSSAYRDHADSPKYSAEAFEWLQRAAELGDPYSQMQLGNNYQRGDGCQRDLHAALLWYRRAADQGQSEALFFLGRMYEVGEGVEKDLAQAISCYQRAVEKGESRAENRLAVLRAAGVEHLLGDAQAEGFLRDLAEPDGNLYIQFEIGLMYYLGIKVPEDFHEAVRWCVLATNQILGRNQRNGHACQLLGLMYENGQGVQQDLAMAAEWHRQYEGSMDAISDRLARGHDAVRTPRALRPSWKGGAVHPDAPAWYRKAAGRGNSEAQFFLAELCVKPGAEKDLQEAVHWYREAARQGEARAQHRLGALYGAGVAELQSDAEAAGWFRSVVVSDHAGEAMKQIAWMHFMGDGIPADHEKAATWARRAAEMGNVSGAGWLLGLLYENGLGVPEDPSESIAWYRRAAEAGDPIAAASVAGAFKYGKGVPVDLEQAAFWYRKSVDGGYQPAQGYLDELLSGLSGGAPATPQTPPKRRGLDKVAGMRELKALLRRDVVDHARNPERHRRYGLSLPNGILLYGPPGCGKTYIARLLAEELGHHFVEITPGDVASPFIHDTVKQIRASFDEAAAKAPAIMFIDEFEAFVPPRGGLGGFQQYKAEEVNEFLALLNSCSEKRILVIAATNLPENIDPAVRRTGRLDKLIYVGPPDVDARKEMLAFHLQNRPVSADLDLARLAEQTEGYSASDIKFLVDQAARHAMELDEDLTPGSFRSAMAGITPSVPPEVAQSYRSIAQRGGTSTD